MSAVGGRLFDPGAFEERVLAFSRREGLFAPGEKVVVAVSGGADSLCLLHLLWRRRAELGIGLHAAHLDHMLRGEAGADDARFVAEECQRLGVTVTVERRDPSPLRRLLHLSPEEAARQLRYSFLAEVAAVVGACRVAVGHTADDQAETVLLNLIRGAGSRGLRGMAPLTPWQGDGVSLLVVRPLLEARREETRQYCQALGLQPRQDLTNLYPGIPRNRLRLQLLPQLRSLNPNLEASLLRTARLIGLDLSYLEEAVDAAWAGLVVEGERGLWLDLVRLRGLHPALQHHLLHRALATVQASPQDIAAVHVEALLSLLSRPGSRRLSLPHGLLALKEGERLWLGRTEAPSALPPLEGEYPLNVPGSTRLPGWRVEAEVVPPPWRGEAQPFQAVLDLERAGRGLRVRSRRPGDRFQPLGMAVEKRLQDFLVDTRVPRRERDRVPLVCSPRGILWVVGYRIDERVKVTPASCRLLRLSFVAET